MAVSKKRPSVRRKAATRNTPLLRKLVINVRGTNVSMDFDDRKPGSVSIFEAKTVLEQAHSLVEQQLAQLRQLKESE